ncbi:MAG: hypothetical protein RLZZ230_160 [Candidatus Parcubacteria bacterium]
MNDYLKDLKKVQILRKSLVFALNAGVRFQVSKRSSFWLDENNVLLQLGAYNQVSDLSAGDRVVINSQFERPWDIKEKDDNIVSLPYIVVAFAVLNNYDNPGRQIVDIEGTFCILAKDVDDVGSIETTFLMADKNLDKIALVFTDALERIEE